MKRLREGRPIVVHGDGKSIWSACHRDDVARAFVRAIGNEAAYGKAYNVTGEEWMRYDRYWETAARALGAPEPRLVHIPTDLLGGCCRSGRNGARKTPATTIYSTMPLPGAISIFVIPSLGNRAYAA